MTPETETHLKAQGNLTRKQVMINNFLGGLAWGLGTVIGATVVVAILISVLKTVNFVPVVGGFVSDILQSVETRQLQR